MPHRHSEAGENGQIGFYNNGRKRGLMRTEDEETSIVEATIRDGLAGYFRSQTPERKSASYEEMSELELANLGLAALMVHHGKETADEFMSSIYAEFDRRGVPRERALSLIDGLLSFYTHGLTASQIE
jgi:hypothetical protein